MPGFLTSLRTYLLAPLCAVVLRTSAAEPPPVRFRVAEFEVVGANPFSAAQTSTLLAPHIGEYSGLDGLMAAVDTLQHALLARGFPLHRVVLPPQTLDLGRVQLEIVMLKLQDLKIEGNQHFDDANIKRSLPTLVLGKDPNPRTIGQDLQVANRHPAKNLNVRLAQSEQSGAIDAIVSVDDQKPYNLVAGVNNTGTRDTGRIRVSLGAQYNNLFNRDQRIGIAYTTSPENIDDVEQISATYQIPLYAAHGFLDGFFSKSDVDIGQIGDFAVSGAGQFWGVNFTRVLRRQGRYRHEWSLGFQNRFFENNIDFLNTTPLGVNVRSSPLVVGYSGGFNADQWRAAFSLSYARNIAIGRRNNGPAYAAARSGAESDWDAIRVSGEVNYTLFEKWLGRMHMDGQWAGEPMIAGEQFGLGGWRSIRGLDERAVIGDNGLRVGLELWTPPIILLRNLRVLAFLDAGIRERESPQPGEVASDTVASVGVGARWQWRDSFGISLDYGRTVAEGEGLTAQAPDKKGVKWHFNVYYRF